MMTEPERLNDHEKFRELCALANSGTLAASERAELNGHLQVCEECSKAYHQYNILAIEGIPLLAARYGNPEAWGKWDDAAARKKLFARFRAEKMEAASEPAGHSKVVFQPDLLRRILAKPLPLAGAALAACLVIAVGFITYRAGSRAQAGAKQAQVSTEIRLQNLAAEKEKAVDELDGLIAAQAKTVSRLQKESSQRELELANLQSALRKVKDRASELAAANSTSTEQVQTVLHERNALSGQLRDAEQAHQNDQAALASLRDQHNDAAQRSASLESKIDELSARNRDEEGRLRDDEQYLAYDRDIRELMGARNLYIADVFDVDSGSRTRKPFGRVFYTEGQSLLFYAFDLDRQAHLKNVSAFQAWGVTGAGQKQPLNLGVFYMDNKSNRRWVLRFDDPKQLAEIDAVFVTVEPQGGSRKPTGKPFLYAWLRKEANHP